MPLFSIIILSIAHALNDGYLDMIPPLLPVFAERYRLTAAQLGTLMLALTIPANFGQPVLGVLVDRHRYRGAAATGLLLGLAGIGWVALGHTVSVLAAALFLAGVGTAVFHPSAGAWVGELGGARGRAGALSIFASVGAVGYAAGALVGPLLYSAYGMEGVGWAVMVALSWVALVLLAERTQKKAIGSTRTLSEVWRQRRGLGAVLATTTLRSVAIGAFSMFLPILAAERGLGLVAGGWALFCFLGASSVGLAMGGLADRVGRRQLTIMALTIGGPLMAMGALVPGVAGLTALCVGGLVLRLSEPGNIAQAQEIIVGSSGTAAGMAMGLSWGIASLTYPGVGAAADAFGMSTALAGCAALCLLAVLPAAVMPETRAQ